MVCVTVAVAVLLGQIIHFLHKVMIVYKIPDWYDALCAIVLIFSTGNFLHCLLLQCEHIYQLYRYYMLTQGACFIRQSGLLLGGLAAKHYEPPMQV